MAGRKPPRERIEPGFSAPVRADAPQIGPADRVTAGQARRSKTKAKPSTGKRRAKAERKPGRGRFFRFFRFTFYWGIVLGLWAVLGIGALFAWYGMQLPHSSSWEVPNRPPNARIVSVEGTLIANRGVTGGESVPLNEMSPYIPLAVIAIEDHRFKSHFGIDPLGIARAMVANIQAGRLVQGGSTLTQQLAKNLFLEPRRDLERKVQEAIIAVWLEQNYSKDEILELYLNRVYFGSGAYGVDAAARRYFNKSARDVNLGEAALLAGLLKAPSALSPARNPKGAQERAQLVLEAMRREGFVSDSEVASALSLEAKKAKRFWTGSQHYAADLVMKQLETLIGDLPVDVIVDTTIDLTLQKEAGRIIKETIAAEGEKRNVSQGALIAIDGTGAIRAMVGGAEYADSQFNRAVDAKRQPGSAFKPFVYLAAIERGLNPDAVRVDRPVTIGAWKPENYDRKFRGPVTISEALSLSLNTIAAQLVADTGADAVIEVANRMGIGSKLARNASIALGTSEVSLLDLTAAYTPFANGGYLAEPFLIKRVVSRDGQVLYERNPAPAPKVIESTSVGMMNEMLRRTVEEGTGKRGRFGNWEIGGKTGTTQNFKDAWFIGYTANLVTGVWYGNDDGEPMKKVTGGGLPAATFASFMDSAHSGVPLASLPGFYLPKTVDVVPTPSPLRRAPAPARELAPSPLGTGVFASRDGGINGAVPARQSAPRPNGEVGGGVGGEQPRRKNLIELLLGG